MAGHGGGIPVTRPDDKRVAPNAEKFSAATAPQCTAESKGTGERCQRFAMKGLDKCPIHCGMTLEQARERARLNMAVLLDPALGRVVEVIDDDSTTPMERIATAKYLSDRVFAVDESDAKVTADQVRALRDAVEAGLEAMGADTDQRAAFNSAFFPALRAAMGGGDSHDEVA